MEALLDADAPADAPAAPLDASTTPAPPEAALAAIDTVALRAHIAALADDAMGGRGTGRPMATSGQVSRKRSKGPSWWTRMALCLWSPS